MRFFALLSLTHILFGLCALPITLSFLFSPAATQHGFVLRASGGPDASVARLWSFSSRASVSSDMIQRSAHRYPFSRQDSVGCIARSRSVQKRVGVLGVVAEAPQLKDVVLPPCKRLCPGCEPWICPLAPKAQVTELSETTLRLEELRKEKVLEAERARMEAVAAGVQSVNSLKEMQELMKSVEGKQTTLIFWGGSWCRKCTALKPKFVTLSQILHEEFGGKLQFIYADAKAVGGSRPDLPPSLALQEIAGIQSVPTFQCWRNGRVLRSYTAELEVKKVMPSIVRMVDECLTLSDEELLAEDEDAEDVPGGRESEPTMRSKWDSFDK